MDNLPTLFNEILSSYSIVSAYSGSHAEEKFNNIVLSACANCEAAIELSNKLDLFSKNETLDDISTNTIRYLILPALFGYFRSQNDQGRQTNLHLAMTLYRDFLSICSENGIPFPCPTVDESRSNVVSSNQSMNQLISNRETKVKRYKMKKSLEERMKELAEYVEQPHVDDEIKREYNIKLVQRWICIVQDELPNLDLEYRILKRRQNCPADNDGDANDDAQPAHNAKPALNKLFNKPFILTRSAVQAAVFGAGYPSLPTMTVEQFYEQQVAAGLLPPPVSRSSNHSDNSDRVPSVRRVDASSEEKEATEQRRAREDELEDLDDYENLMKARRFDNFKDDNRRGSGNRMNRA